VSPPLILLDPYPRTRELIFRSVDWERLQACGTIVTHDGEGQMPSEMVDEHIAEAALVIGQTDLPAQRLERAARLKAILNVEGNFLPNVDYETCFRRGVQVLGAGPAFALPVAEFALGLALDAARGITGGDRAFRAGEERYGLAGNHDAFLLTEAPVGFVGFGHLGRALLPLLQPFRPRIRVYDPWLPDGYLREHGAMPAPLDELLGCSRVVFVLAGVTRENRGMIGARELALMPDGAVLLLISRAPVVDWEAFLAATRSGRLRGATDVFPEEPVAGDDPVRDNDHLILSAHRAGGLREALYRIGEMATDDAQLLLADLPPVRMQPARRETVGRLRSTPGRTYPEGSDR